MVEESLELRAECATKLAKEILVTALDSDIEFREEAAQRELDKDFTSGEIVGSYEMAEYYKQRAELARKLKRFIVGLPNCKEE